VALTVAALATGGSATAATASSYTTPVVAIPTAPGSVNAGYGTGGEPRLLVTHDGRVLVAAHMSQWDCVTGKPTPGTGHQCVWQSRDDGRSFQFSGGEPNQQGDDVDLAESGGVLLESTMTNIGLGTGAGGTTVTRSTDGGKTWTEQVAVNKDVANDRPFMVATPDGGVALTYLSLPGGLLMVRSTDHGATWGLPQPVYVGNEHVVALNGAPAIDAARKKLMVPIGVASSPTCSSGISGCIDTFSIARGNYDGSGFVTEPVLALEPGTGTSSVISSAADSAGTEYIGIATASGATSGISGVYGGTPPTKNAHIQLLTQRLGDTTWTGRRVDPPGGSSMLPSVAAGPAGRVVVAYYWSPYPDAQSTSRPWYTVVADSHDSGRTFTRTVVSKVIWTGTGQDHQFVLWDIFGLALDRQGRVHVAWGQVSKDTSNGPLTEIAYSHQITRGAA
jgi:hypothetical protein